MFCGRAALIQLYLLVKLIFSIIFFFHRSYSFLINHIFLFVFFLTYKMGDDRLIFANQIISFELVKSWIGLRKHYVFLTSGQATPSFWLWVGSLFLSWSVSLLCGFLSFRLIFISRFGWFIGWYALADILVDTLVDMYLLVCICYVLVGISIPFGCLSFRLIHIKNGENYKLEGQWRKMSWFSSKLRSVFSCKPSY